MILKCGYQSKLHLFFCQICTFFSCPKVLKSAFFCQICIFFLFNIRRLYSCKIYLDWVRLELGSPQVREKPPARTRKAPCKHQDINLNQFMVKKGYYLTTFQQGKRLIVLHLRGAQDIPPGLRFRVKHVKQITIFWI